MHLVKLLIVAHQNTITTGWGVYKSNDKVSNNIYAIEKEYISKTMHRNRQILNYA